MTNIRPTRPLGEMAETEKAFDVVIVGGGPAGMSAAIWAGDLGLNTIIVEGGSEPGGNLLNIHNPVTNYPGVIAANGREIRDRFADNFERSGVAIRLSDSVVRIDASSMSLDLSDGNVLRGRHILFATGVRRRTLGLAGEETFRGCGILESGARDPAAVRGMNVAVVGGGDAAAENAAILSRFANRVYLVHRRENLTAREELARKALDMPNVVFLNNRSVVRLHGRDMLESFDVAGPEGKAENIPVDRVIFRLGVVPNSELLANIVAIDPRGYVITDSCGRTNSDWIFAAGDVACPDSPTIVTAAGQAAAAIKVIRSRLN